MNLPEPNARSEAQVSWGVLIFLHHVRGSYTVTLSWSCLLDPQLWVWMTAELHFYGTTVFEVFRKDGCIHHQLKDVKIFCSRFFQLWFQVPVLVLNWWSWIFHIRTEWRGLSTFYTISTMVRSQSFGLSCFFFLAPDSRTVCCCSKSRVAVCRLIEESQIITNVAKRQFGDISDYPTPFLLVVVSVITQKSGLFFTLTSVAVPVARTTTLVSAYVLDQSPGKAAVGLNRSPAPPLDPSCTSPIKCCHWFTEAFNVFV